MNYFIEDLNVFYATIYGGIVIGILFDINSSLKKNFKLISKVSFMFDILFCITVTFTTFIVVNTIERFQLRYYHFIALLVGFLLYHNTISRFVLKFNDIIIGTTKLIIKKTILTLVKILDILYYIIVYSIHFLFDIMLYIPNIIFNFKNKLHKKLLVTKIKKGCVIMNLKKKFWGQYMIFCIFLFSIISVLIVGIFVQLNNIKNYREEISVLEQEIKITQNKINKLIFFENEDDLENLARNKLGMVKDNEIIYLEK